MLDRDSPGFQRACILSSPLAIEPSNHELLESDSCRSARNPQINNTTPGTSANKASPLNMPAKYVFSAAEIPVSISGNIKAAPPAAARIPLKQPHGKHRSRLPPRASQASVLLFEHQLFPSAPGGVQQAHAGLPLLVQRPISRSELSQRQGLRFFYIVYRNREFCEPGGGIDYKNGLDVNVSRA